LSDVDLITRRFNRERKARKEAEALLEVKSRELYDTNSSLVDLATGLEKHIEQRTDELETARDTAVKASQAKSEFLSSMSHELRTPLNAILGFAQLMALEDAWGDEQKDNLSEIEKAGQHLLTLINEILDLAKIEAGKIELTIQDVSLTQLLTETKVLVQPMAEQSNIKLEFSGDCLGTVSADKTRLKQVLLNLLSNAIKYNNVNGSVYLDCHIKNQEFFVLGVRDTGPGIAEERMAGLFEPFERGSAENTGVEGTGIGLVITRRLIELMGGSIHVDSALGQGSTFWVEVPISTNSHENAKQVSRPIKEIEDNPNERKMVLYIEDNAANMRLLTQILKKKTDHELLTALTPSLGLDLAMAHQPDLILLDINLPDMDGYEVLKRLKADDRTSSIPVIAVSANAMSTDIEKASQVGFESYITKPVNIPELLSAMKAVLE